MEKSERCRPTRCNIFYQQQEFMNIENFYALKKLEWEANREHESAIKIQALFRGWLIRKNLELLNEAAIKIQSLVRGFLARRRFAKMKKDVEKAKEEKLRHDAATKLQKLWRGYYSRKNCLDYRKCKELQCKNSAFCRRIDALNDLESLATLSSSSVKSTASLNTLLNKLLLKGDDLSDLLKLSPARICALQEYIEKVNEELISKGKKPSGQSVKLAEQLKSECQRSCYKEDSLDRLFPDLPDGDGFIKPDKEKAARLKAAMRKLRDNIEAAQSSILEKQHHLLRTHQQPGILSDICSHELTPAEQKLKSLKFWKCTLAPTATERRKLAREEEIYWKNYARLRHQSRIQRKVSLDSMANRTSTSEQDEDEEEQQDSEET